MTDVANRGITCPRYQRSAKGKRCAHYWDGGRCIRPGGAQTTCVEWVRVNGGPVAPTVVEGSAEADPTPVMSLDRDLFGNPVQPERPRRGSRRESSTKATAPVAAPAPTTPPKPPLIRNVTDEEIASFKALGSEVCIRSEEVGEVWVVPEYTGADRAELSVEHSITLTTICASFPGAKVVEIRRAGA